MAKTDRPLHIEKNVVTGEVTERPLNDEEYVAWLAAQEPSTDASA